MAAYFHGNSSEIGGDGATGDGLQTLILMNPGYMGYSDGNQNTPPPHGGNFVFLNHNSHGSSSPHASLSQDQHHFVGIPLQGGAVADTSPNSGHEQQAVSAPHSFLPPRIHYSLYNLPVDLGPAPDLEVTPQAQGISLSLSSLHSPPPNGSFNAERPDSVQPQAELSPARGDAYGFRILWGTPSPASGITTGVSLVQSVLPSSKYLKAAQDLLHEVVNVGRVAKGIPDPSVDVSSLALMSGEGQSGRESSEKRGPEPDLTSPERQEIQIKKSKLVNMLDEVEQRYRQHHQQMQMVVSWFEQEAGVGSAETYTAAALQTISKQFRCLKDAILSQIRAAGRSLGEGPRLKHVVDNQIRQQRALQQLGMIQHNPWRPQRGLPERSVSVLRAWLFEHFLHPYPKDSDKTMLAKQTGLTRSQVSNWFINARVRLWKPMVEEMYTEEMKAHHDKNASHDGKTNNTNTKIEHDDLTPNTEQEHHDTNPPPPLIPISSPSGPTSVLHHMPSEIESPKKLRFGPNMGRAGYGLMDGPTNFVGGFGGYPMGELGRFGPEPPPFHGGGGLYPGNGVSLTLGLPLYEAHQTLLQASNERMAMQIGEGGHPTNVYESISAQDRKMFVAQLLPDFVS